MKTLHLIRQYFIPIAGLLLIPCTGSSQEEGISMQLTYDQQNAAPPPETWMFLKYGGQQPNLYTGTVQANIPIYIYKDKDFEIPLTLTYASNGYLPNVQASSVGLGWMLKAGGFIHQEINGRSDTSSGSYGDYVQKMPESDRPLMSRIWINGDGVPIIPTTPPYREPHYETTPDIFSFNFCGHSGKFVMTHSGVRVYNTNHPSGEYKVGFPRNGVIEIVTGDGYLYTFTQHAVSIRNENTYDQRSSYVNSGRWDLTKIEAPNGRTVVFGYSEHAYDNRRAAGLSNTFYQDWKGKYWRIVQNEFNYKTSETFDPATSFSPYVLASSGKINLLNSITIDGTVLNVELLYSDRKYRETGWSSYAAGGSDPGALNGTSSLPCPPKLDRINIRSNVGNGLQYLLKSCSLEYDYGVDSGNRVMMLKNVKLSGEGTYEMKYYNDQEPFPYQGTPAIDHWGYYNGQESNTLRTAIPDPYLHGHTACFNSASRDPHSEYAIQGMLRQITYPTGGRTVYEYESHDFSKVAAGGGGIYLEQNFNSPNYKINNTTWRTGGVRVKSIKDYAVGSQTATSKTYIYKDAASQNSGIITNLPQYINLYWFPEAVNEDDEMKRRAQAFHNMNGNLNELFGYMAGKTHIEYGAVREVSSEGSYTVYHYTNSQDTGDEYGPGNYYTAQGHDEPPQDELPVSLEFDRGKLVLIEHYDSSGQIKSTTENHYDYSKQLSYIAQAKIAPFTAYEHWIYTDDYPLKGTTTTTTFGPGRSISSTVNYDYNALNQLVQTTSVGSKEETIRVRNTYAHEMAPGAVRDSIVSKNLVALPLKEIKTVQEETGTEQIVDVTQYTYDLFYGLVLPSSVATGNNLPVPLSATPSLTGEISFDRYDAFGNLLQTTDKSGNITSYVWGYGGLCLLAKIENTTIEEVMGKGFPNLMTSLIPTNLSATQERALHRWGWTTLYDHRPLVGLTKITDPYYISTYYEYNSDQKLYRILDNDRKVLKHYNYSTDNQ